MAKWKYVDITGQKFGAYTVIEYTGVKRKWLCRCDCGTESLITSGSLRIGGQTMCRRCRNAKGFPFEDLSGKKFGRWTVIEFSGRKMCGGKPKILWKCICDCGTIKYIGGPTLRRGESKSCGCLRVDYGKTATALPFGEAVFNTLYDDIRRRAKKKGHEFDLTKDQFKEIIGSDCVYCGESPKERRTPNSNGYCLANGVDRVDSSVGYVFSNSVPCCGKCNIMKMGHAVDEWLSHMIKILEYYKNRNVGSIRVLAEKELKNN